MRHAQPLMLPGCHAHVLKKYRVHICSAWLLENAGAMCAEGKGPRATTKGRWGAAENTNELLELTRFNVVGNNSEQLTLRKDTKDPG